jgi:hypothetical protein
MRETLNQYTVQYELIDGQDLPKFRMVQQPDNFILKTEMHYSDRQMTIVNVPAAELENCARLLDVLQQKMARGVRHLMTDFAVDIFETLNIEQLTATRS